MNYYNEFNPFAAAWLQELVNQNQIPYGHVDTRSITEVRPAELQGYTQCHFFAGIGGWSLALRYAGFPEDRKIWTGSCPCQPFSQAGKGDGFDDERHLWPAFHWLISQCKPDRIVGEQVASKDGIEWFDLVSADLEGEGYSCGTAVLPACSIGSPQLRVRQMWLALSDYQRLQRGERGGTASEEGIPGGHLPQRGSVDHPSGGNPDDFWGSPEWVAGHDGKKRPSESGSSPLVDGVSEAMGRMCGYGNAIVPQLGAAFLQVMDSIERDFSHGG